MADKTSDSDDQDPTAILWVRDLNGVHQRLGEYWVHSEDGGVRRIHNVPAVARSGDPWVNFLNGRYPLVVHPDGSGTFNVGDGP